MLPKKKSPSVKPESNAKNIGQATALEAEAASNLVGFFDVLIEMDLNIKEQERKKKDEEAKT